MLLTRLLGSEQEGFVSYDDPGGATNDIVKERYKNPSVPKERLHHDHKIATLLLLRRQRRNHLQRRRKHQ